MKKVKSQETSPWPAQLRDDGICTGHSHIPLDLTVEILKKLPAKSLVRFQCLSKLWLAIISRSRDFIESILTRSLNQPPRDAHLLFESYSSRRLGCLLVFSNENTKKASLSILDGMHQYVRGLILCWSLLSNEAAIYNLTTRQSFHLPKIKTSPQGSFLFGYDPLGNQYKVLFVPATMDKSYQVFTLGDPPCKQWRTIQGIEFHCPMRGAICLNGAIYYRGKTTTTTSYKLISFDVKSEEFCYVKAPRTLRHYTSRLVNYQGKLGFVCCQNGMEIWVREDCDQNTQRWTKIFFYKMKGWDIWRVSGVTRGGEIILVKWNYKYDQDMLGVYYYDPKQNSMRFVNLESAYAGEIKRPYSIEILTLPDHVDNTIYLY